MIPLREVEWPELHMVSHNHNTGILFVLPKAYCFYF
jgi:hypothetical protein